MTHHPLSRERWLVLEPFLDAALELATEDRAAFLHDLSERDPGLHAELAELLHACEMGNTILSESANIRFAQFLVDSNVEVPAQLDHYRIIREVGRGGMATVYLADDPKHGRQVAVKVLRPDVALLVGRERFRREIEIAAGLSHPHILPLHDSGEMARGDSSLLYFVSPYVAGESLHDVLRRAGRMTEERTITLGGEVARALDYAHREGVVHLDIKPGNILLQDGHAVVADFGIARAISRLAGDEGGDPGLPLGTPNYMSPEQIAHRDDIDGRSDIYSFGCLLYEMITGERPRVASAAMRTPDHQFSAGGPDPLRLSECCSPALASLIMRATASSRDERFATAGDVADALFAVQVAITPVAQARARKHRGFVTGSVVLAVAALLFAFRSGLSNQFTPRQPTAVAAIPRDKAIAVLPFVSASPDSAEDYFSDGLTEDLITLLAKSTDMRVAARAATFKFRHTSLDARDIGRQLNVAYLLQGNVAKSGDTLRISVTLIKADDGSSVWSETYDRRLDDVFAVRDEIAVRAIRALKTTLLANALTGGARPHNATSYNLVLRGRHFMSQPTQENVERAVQFFDAAIRDDPANALAHAWLARARLEEAGQGWIPVADGYRAARNAAEVAIAADSNLADGYEALAFEQSAYEWDWEAAGTNYRRALELEPGNADVLRTAALLMMKLGRYDEAIIGLRKAVERDPTAAAAYSNLSYAFGAAGRWRESETAARSALALGPNAILRHFNLARALVFQGKPNEALREVELETKESWRLMGLAIAYHALGRKAESDRALADFEEKYATFSAMQIAEVHAFRGEVDGAFEWLERACRQRDPGVTDLLDDPWLAGMREDPRYVSLLKRVRLTS